MTEGKHKLIRVENLMYKGCESHWKCVHCGIYVPFHCYKKEVIENSYCKDGYMGIKEVNKDE